MPMTAEQLQYQQRSVRGYQEYLDNALETVGERAPDPVLGHSPSRYLRRALIDMKRALPDEHPLKSVPINGYLQDDGLEALKPQIIQAYLAERRCPHDLAEGELRRWDIKDQMTGRVSEIRFQGRESFVKNPAYGHRPGRHVIIRNPDTHPCWFPREVPSPLLSGRLTMTAA
jgi:hypothetical protein